MIARVLGFANGGFFRSSREFLFWALYLGKQNAFALG